MAPLALVVIDVQRGFDDSAYWGPRNNPSCEANVAALIAAWRDARQPIVYVRHHWEEEGSPLRPGEPGAEFKDVVQGRPDLLVTKSVHSAFHGDPDLAEWLRNERVERLVICGIQTNMAARRRRASAQTSASKSCSRSTPRTPSTRTTPPAAPSPPTRSRV